MCKPYTIYGRLGASDAIRTLYAKQFEISEGLGGGILEGFGVLGVDLQEPGNDFCGFVAKNHRISFFQVNGS